MNDFEPKFYAATSDGDTDLGALVAALIWIGMLVVMFAWCFSEL